ncbi:hypothetical protein AB0K18_24120 [Nonomuraea sp. NPDC049421]|uniref:hypothetical protein n=1 Tax=Nonomuraea sp. NPDC049421 TaxID=3155275 RepID=UPI003442CB27
MHILVEDMHLDRSAYLLLSRIRREGPMSIGQLSRAFGLDDDVERLPARPWPAYARGAAGSS